MSIHPSSSGPPIVKIKYCGEPTLPKGSMYRINHPITRHCTNAGLMLAHCFLCWPYIHPPLAEYSLFAGMLRLVANRRNTISSPWVWKGVSATLSSGRYILSYPSGRYRLLYIKGCICHFVEWQIHPFISKWTISSPPSINSYNAGIYFSRQNLTSTDVRFWRLKSIPAL